MKAYILNGKVHDVIDYDHAAYSFPPESWHPEPEDLFEFDYVYTPYIVKQETPYDPKRKWFDAVYVLQTIKKAKRKDFDAAFTEIDTKSPRASRGLILSLIDGSFPSTAMLYDADALSSQQAPTLTPEEEQRIIDVGIMWELEEVANTNRDAWHKLLALAVTDEMPLEEVQAVLMQAMEIKPWLPWKIEQPVPPLLPPEVPVEPLPPPEQV